MHSALIFKGQVKLKDVGLREKGITHPNQSIHNFGGLDNFFITEKRSTNLNH
jgi:hypothetical protein